MDDIVEGIKVTTGLDYTTFFARYIHGNEVIPVSDYFDIGKALWDYTWNTENKRNHQYLYKTLGVVD